MLLLAPVVIISVAGYSLGAMYGTAARRYVLPVVDSDGGEVANRLLEALGAEASIRVEPIADLDAARRLVGSAEGPALAIDIPPDTSAAIRAGRAAHLVLYVDPAKRIAVNALQVRLAELCRAAITEAQAAAQQRLDAAAREVQREIDGVAGALGAERDRLRRQIDAARTEASETLRADVTRAMQDATRRVEAEIRRGREQAQADVESQLAARRGRLDELRDRLQTLRTSKAAFEQWLAQIRTLAGSHAGDIPPPPAFPALPSDAELAELTRPIALPRPPATITLAGALPVPSITLPALDPPDVTSMLERRPAVGTERLPGVLGLVEEPAMAGGSVTVNAFDQYVPGFGVTFLLIGMMLGIALTLFDERDWGTLQRLEANGAPLAGLLLGKLVTRFGVGVVQMVVLFGIGRVLFGISLGREPLALLLPTIGISFAAAGLGLIVPAVARSHDGVMPLGVMISMAMAAIGGCWWPLDFEPSWMRAIARWLPTTWTMHAYNDLMIRGTAWPSVLRPFAITMALGGAYVATGLAAHLGRRSG
jgi:ABC-type multidrug transport system permease subunit